MKINIIVILSILILISISSEKKSENNFFGKKNAEVNKTEIA